MLSLEVTNIISSLYEIFWSPAKLARKVLGFFSCKYHSYPSLAGNNLLSYVAYQ